MNDTVLLEKRDAIAFITFNRPERLNALNDAMMAGLHDALKQTENDEAIRAVVLRGAGSAFMAGGDVAMFHANKDKLASEFLELGNLFHESIKIMRRMPKPIVASVHGACAGGGLSVMLACDIAIAAENAQFTLAYARIGASPDGGSTYFLPRIVGTRKALELALLPEPFDARTAHALGLVNFIVADTLLDAEIKRIAARLAAGPTAAFARTKALINSAFDSTLEQQLDLEIKSFAECATGNDFKEGVTAFVEKRKPVFKGY